MGFIPSGASVAIARQGPLCACPRDQGCFPRLQTQRESRVPLPKCSPFLDKWCFYRFPFMRTGLDPLLQIWNPLNTPCVIIRQSPGPWGAGPPPASPCPMTDVCHLGSWPAALGELVSARKWSWKRERIRLKAGGWKQWALYLLKAAWLHLIFINERRPNSISENRTNWNMERNMKKIQKLAEFNWITSVG